MKLSEKAADIENHDFYPLGYQVESEDSGHIVVGVDYDGFTPLTWPMEEAEAQALIDELNVNHQLMVDYNSLLD